MKNIFLKVTGLLLASLLFVFVGCEKDDLKTLNDEMATWQSENITSTSVELSGMVIAQGSGFNEYGVVYGLAENPTTSDTKVEAANVENAVYWVSISDLDHLTTYHYRAYAIDKSGTVLYGDDETFTTLAHVPTVTINEATAITDVTARIVADVPYDGKADVTAKGIVYSTSQTPTLDDEVVDGGEGMGEFTIDLTGLVANTTYYVRAYATNKIGTVYSTEISFTTTIGVATVETISATGEVTTATVIGNVSYNGGASITERGICYGTSENPSVDDEDAVIVTSEGTTGQFIVDLEGLEISTTYHVRAYAVNSEGVAYGEDIAFSTYPTDLYMTGSGVGEADENWNWAGELQFVPVNSHPELFWKIVWMKGSGDFKIAPQAAWSGDFGITGDATNGVYTIGGDNIPVPSTAGYYMVVVDLANNTVEITDPQIFGMGDVFGGWDGGDPAALFTVDNDNSVIKFDGVPNSGELRMYVAAPTLNCDWWQAEFIVLNDKIEFRGTGGDQSRATVAAGDNISLNFRTGAGSITTP